MMGEGQTRFILLAALSVTFANTSCGRIGFDALPEARQDAGTELDAGQQVAGNGCEVGADFGTVALYSFDDPDAVMTDLVGEHPGYLVGSPGLVPSRDECGSALSFAGRRTEYGVIPHDVAWELDEGSVDFWLRMDAFPIGRAGLLSRDASGTTMRGHMSIAVSSDGAVGVRIQRQGLGDSDGQACSSPGTLLLGTWMHLGVNFGPPGLELWVDGQSLSTPGPVILGPCQSEHDEGISGNANPWVLGAATFSSPEGEEISVDSPASGAIDHLRISSIRRDFR